MGCRPDQEVELFFRDRSRACLGICQKFGITLPESIVEVLQGLPGRPVVMYLNGLLFVSSQVKRVGSIDRVIIVCTQSTILSFHDSTDGAETVARTFQSERCLQGRVPLAVFLELMDVVLNRLSNQVFDFRGELEVLSERVESGEEHLAPADHLALKQEVMAMEARYEDHLYSVSRIAKYVRKGAMGDPVDGGEDMLFRARLDLERGLKSVERLKGRINGLNQFQLAQADETTNRRLNILTVLSAIYLPPTLIAGIYGMNFEDIPIVGMSHGYAVVVAIMIGLVIGQVVFFYKRGWFR